MNVKKIWRIICLFLLGLSTQANAQVLTATDDAIKTGPSQKVRYDVTSNDVISCNTYTLEVVSITPSSGGTAVFDGDFLVFTPATGVSNATVSVVYELACKGGSSVQATVTISILDSNLPLNVIQTEEACIDQMPENVDFDVQRKYIAYSEADRSPSQKGGYLQPFHIPLVGDLNGDGKPEIVVSGVSAGGSLDNYIDNIHIFDGQTGKLIINFNLSTLGTGYGHFQIGNSPWHHSPSHLAIADLDKDGIGEIIVCQSNDEGKVYSLKPVLDGSGKIINLTKAWDAEYGFKYPLSVNYQVFGQVMPFIVDINADGIPEVVVYNKIYNGVTGKLLMAWDGEASSPKASSVASGTGLENYRIATPLSQTAATNIKARAMVGRRNGQRASTNYRDDGFIAVPAIADIDGDGQMEIITGTRIHKFQINSLTDHTQNTYTTKEGPTSVTVPVNTAGTTTETYYLSDGFTRVADIDGDGQLDVIVMNQTTGTYGSDVGILLYIYDPTTGVLKAASSLRSNGTFGNFGIPFVGDINNILDGRDVVGGAWTKKVPEILFCAGRIYRDRSTSDVRRSGMLFHPLSDMTGERFGNTTGKDGHIIAVTYDGGEAKVEDRLKISWALEHYDQSNNTGITMFDFNNDGAFDLCYRDEETLRVISPKLNPAHYIRTTATPTNNDAIIFSTKVNSETGFEAPVIADVNMDGSADIVVAGWMNDDLYWANTYTFERKTGSPMWAPCPPVWNQALYNPLYINEDLTVPAKPISMLTSFTNGKSETIQPYNGAWIQQPIVKEGDPYVPVYRHPDAVLTNMRVERYGASQTKIILTIRNDGLASINANTPVHFYMTPDLVTPSNAVTDSVRVDIFPNEKVTLEYIINASPTGMFVHCRLVDDGTNFPAAGFTDCNLTNNYGYTSLIRAVDDYFTAFREQEMKYNITVNDTVIGLPRPEIYEGPKYGIASIESDGKLSYTANSNAPSADTIIYLLKCDYNGTTLASVDTAYVYLKIADKPDNISDADCVGLAEGDVFSIQHRPYATPVTQAHPYFSPVVGDVDDDGDVEILLAKSYESYRAKDIQVVDGKTGAVKETVETPSMTSNTSHAIYKVDGVTHLLIPVAPDYSIIADRSYLYAYKYDKIQKKFVFAWKSDRTFIDDSAPSFPAVADLDGDGTPEVIVGQTIFNGRTGIALAQFPTGVSTTTIANSIGIGDVLSNGTQQLVFAGRVYSVQFANKNAFNTTAFTLEATAPATSLSLDRHVALADFNNDGHLDVLFVGVKALNVTTSTTIVYAIWDVRNNRFLGSSAFESPIITASGGFAIKTSIPMIGDVNGDGLLEFIFMTYNKLFCYTYNPSTDAIETYWTYSVQDQSGATGITLFDFNQDNNVELVYRDEEKLWILDGSEKNNCKMVREFDGIYSGTGNEYSIVADINNDGSAEIVTIGAQTKTSNNGTLYILGAGDGKAWAPARKVWNQYAYNAVNINEDLTVPKYPLSPATVFPGDGISGEVRPYNAFLQQQTILNKNGTPLWLTPNGIITGSPVFNYNVAADSMIITIKVANEGDAAFQNPFYISVYKDIVGGAPSYTYKYENVIIQGDSAVITFGLSEFKTKWHPFNNILIRINDNGNGYNHQQVCDSAYRDYESSNIIASDDHVLVFKETNSQIKVANNDILPAGCISPTVEVLSIPSFTGAINVSGSVIEYTPAAGETADTLRYLIHCGDATKADTATVYIAIVEKPDNIIEAKCVGDVQATEWSIVPSYMSNKEVQTFGQPLAGDVDDDGEIEIVTWNYSGHIRQSNRILIYDKQLKLKYSFSTPLSGYVAGSTGGSTPHLAMADVNNDGKAEIFAVVGNHVTNTQLVCYEYDENVADKWKQKWITPFYLGHYAPIPTIADLDADGIPEIIVNDKIINAQTGALLASFPAGKPTGLSQHAGSDTQEAYVLNAVGDVDNDGLLEIAVGTAVYKYKNGTLTTLAELPSTLIPGIKTDGATSLADVNLDGYLDVVVVARNSDAARKSSHMYVWDVRTESLIGQPVRNNVTDIDKGFGSTAFIGNVDGENHKYPEIALSYKNGIVCWQWNEITEVFDLKWRESTTDESGMTTMSMFDFNQDGKQEIVYRDMDSLRIINGNTGKNISAFYCGSWTGIEYPIIADVNNDGSAEIIVSGVLKGENYSGAVRLMMFIGGENLWAPARKVWNQFSYNAVNINENLTVPKIQLNPGTVFPGPDGQIGTSDDIRPYNGYLMQQTILNTNGIPLWLAPDYMLDGATSTTYHAAGDSLVISFCVKNTGDADGPAPFYVSVYKDAVLSGNAVAVAAYPAVPHAGGAAVCYSIKIPNLASIASNVLILSINDKGEATYVTPECNYSPGQEESFDMSNMVKAENDFATVFMCDEVLIPILKNDKFSGSSFTITDGPKYGTATPSGSQLTYKNTGGMGLTCDQTANMVDTITYEISSVSSSSTAKVFIHILNAPDMVMEGACSVSPRIALTNNYSDMTYTWERSADGTSGWQEVSSGADVKLNVTEPGFYRVTIKYNDNKFYKVSKGVEVVLNRKVTLPGGVIWYDMSYSVVNINW